MTTATSQPSTPDQIWSADLFARRSEAELLIHYIDAVAARPPLREDKKGYTISVDADYGVGKSFFLRRLSEHLEIDHAVAFVDAWQDDLADEPLIAIASTLKKALNPYIVADRAVENRWKKIAAKTGEVAKIVTKGLVEKGIGLLITGAAVEAAELAMSDMSDGVEEAISEAAKEAGSSAFDAFDKADPETLIGERIASFEAGKIAVEELKENLRALVDMLGEKGIQLPIVIIIDELDRCRPTYAIKLLEEAKHLFDVHGVVFVFGMHAEQLSYSVSGAYGPNFDGRAYLRRFIDREYVLAYPTLQPLIEFIIASRSIDVSRLMFPRVTNEGSIPASDLISRYMHAYGLTARDAYGVMDIIETSLNITAPVALSVPLLLPLLIGHMRGYRNAAPPIINEFEWTYDIYNQGRQRVEFSPTDLFDRMLMLAGWTWKKIGDSYNNDDPVAELMFEFRQPSMHNELALPTGYKKLLATLSSFSV